MAWYWSCSIHGTSGSSSDSGIECPACVAATAKLRRAERDVVKAACSWYAAPEGDEQVDIVLKATIVKLKRLEDELGVVLQ